MNSPLPRRTVSRSRWLTQLTAALDEAQHLLAQLITHGDDPAEVRRLRAHILALSCEIELLRKEGFTDRQTVSDPRLPPNWRGNIS